MDTIQQQFNEVSAQYDRQRQFLIPCYHDFYCAAYPLLQQLQQPVSLLDMVKGHKRPGAQSYTEWIFNY